MNIVESNANKLLISVLAERLFHEVEDTAYSTSVNIMSIFYNIFLLQF